MFMYYSFVEFAQAVKGKGISREKLLLNYSKFLYQQGGESIFYVAKTFSHFFNIRLGLKNVNCYLLDVVSAYLYGFILKTNRIVLFSQFGLELRLLVFLK